MKKSPITFIFAVLTSMAVAHPALTVEPDTTTSGAGNQAHIGYSFEGPVATSSDTLIISSRTKIKILLPEAGQDYTLLYALNTDEAMTYRKPISIDEEGSYALYCSATRQEGDTVKNALLVKVDNHGPEIHAEFGFNHIVLSKHICEDGKITEATVFPHGTVLSVSASDLAGVKAIYYSIDKAYERRYMAPVRLTAKGNHTVKFRAIDLVGNETESEGINFIVVE